MSYELSQRFFFEAAHTLRREVQTAGSARVHGHTYHAEATVMGEPDAETGMVVDLGLLRQRIEVVRALLDHHFLNEVEGLGAPTLEHICAFLARNLSDLGAPLSTIKVWREATGDSCLLRLPAP